MKFAPLKPKFFIFFLGLFLSPFFLSAQGFESWKDLHIYYKKNNFDPSTITEEQLKYLPILSNLPPDFDELQDVGVKKKLFYLITLPIITEANDLILEDRKMILIPTLLPKSNLSIYPSYLIFRPILINSKM